MTSTDPWQPVLGDAIGPSRGERTRSGVLLALVIVALGVALAAGLGIAVVSIFALFGAAIG